MKGRSATVFICTQHGNLHLKNPKRSIFKNPLEPLSKFSDVAGYKFNIHTVSFNSLY